MIWPRKAVHTGTWVGSARHGAGTYRDGERAGTGRFTWPEGRSYEGAWHTGMRHGEGVETLPGGVSRRCTWRWGDVVRRTCTPARR